MTTAQAALDHLHLIGTDRPMAEIAPQELVAEVIALLEHPGFRELPSAQRGSALFRVLLIYSGSWQSEGQQVIPAAERAFAALVADAPEDVTALCSGYDALHFLHWCRTATLEEQGSFGRNVIAPFAAAIRATASPARVAPDTRRAGIGYLAQFITPGPGNAIAGANRVILETLARRPGDGPVFLYAWMFHDAASVATYEALGIRVRVVDGNSPAERIEKLEQAIALDRPEVLISDMNGSIPAVVFERRSAPVQILYQFGMPHWPLVNLDAIFRVWDFDPALAGYDPARCITLTIPYDLTPFQRPADPALLAATRASLPPGRLVGTYGRLAKITPAFIGAVAEGIRDHDDVIAVFGGSGDPGPVGQAIAEHGLRDRMVVRDGYVEGHVWGHLLDVFLDTFPQPGGASCLEVIAKGKPVVSLLTSEARNLALEQRVASLRAETPGQYGAILTRLLGDPAAYAQACVETRALAAAYPTAESYGADLAKAIRLARDFAGRRGLRAWLRRFGLA